MEKDGLDIQKILQEMREEYWRGIEEGGDASIQETRDFLVFELGGERFGIPTTSAMEVLRMPRLVKVPRVEAHILGIFNLRGQIVAVTDLRHLLGLGQRELRGAGQMVVIRAADLVSGLRVDQVEGIYTFPVDSIEPLTEGLSHFPREAVSGQTADALGLVVFLDLEHIFNRSEFVVDQKKN